MRKFISPNDKNITWTGAISFDTTEDSVHPTRIQTKDRTLYDSGLVYWADMSAGMTLSFQTTSCDIEILADCPADEYLASDTISPVEGWGSGNYWGGAEAYADLYVDGIYADSQATSGTSSILFSELANEMKLVQIWLPHLASFTLRGINIEEGSEIAQVEPSTKPRWIAYGSSITQCIGSVRPSDGWTAIISRSLNLELVSMGYGGEAHLDPLLACNIRDEKADVITIDIGSVPQVRNTLNQRTFGPGLMAFIKIIREKHPTTPILVFSPIYFEDREDTVNNVGMTMKMMRTEIEKAIKSINDAGDSNTHYKNGLEIFKPEHVLLMPDFRHPTTEGYAVIAEALKKEIGSLL